MALTDTEIKSIQYMDDHQLELALLVGLGNSVRVGFDERGNPIGFVIIEKQKTPSQKTDSSQSPM